MPSIDDKAAERFYHGTRAHLQPGDLIEPGDTSNYGSAPAIRCAWPGR